MRPGWTIRRHVLAWLVLAVFASLYLAKLYYFPPSGRSAAEPAAPAVRAQDDSPFSGGAAERDLVSQEEAEGLRSEIATLRQQVETLEQEGETLRRRLARIEKAFGPDTGALPPQEAERSATGSVREEKADFPPLPPATVTLSPLPDDGFGDTMIDASPLPVANERTAHKTLFGVELASGSTAGDLEREWAALNERYEELLGRLEARRRKDKESGSDGPAEMTLIAGPFPNAAGAAQLCARLNADGARCKATVFAGEAL